MPDKVKIAFTVPTEQPVLYPIAVVAASSNAGGSRTLRRLRRFAAGAGGAGALRLRQALTAWRLPGSRLASRSRSRCWATALDLVLGVAAGFALARLRFPGRELVDSILLLPMVLPPTVLGYYLLVVVGRRGWIGGWLEGTLRHPPRSSPGRAR